MEKILRFLKEHVIPKPVFNLIQPAYHFLWAFLAGIFFGAPSKRMIVVGVTGTKGKTTTLDFMNAIFETAGKKTALLSSVRKKIDRRDGKNPYANSMPGRGAIQKFLKEAAAAGCEIAFIEVTSEGVTKFRHRFIHWDAAVFLNLTPEHVEAHGSFEAYRNAKLSFFRSLRFSNKRTRIFVINGDDPHASYFEEAAEKVKNRKIFTFHRDDVINMADLLKREANPDWLLADFNVENMAAAVALAKVFNVPEVKIIEALKNFRGLKGRLDFVQKEPFAVVVDYAHTPASLRLVYETLRQVPLRKKGSRLICVLGSAGGGRDKWKRPELGAIAGHYCNEIFITNEDPYDEDPEKIMTEIYSGVPSSNYPPIKVHRLLDRKEAIEEAIAAAEAGDVVIMTGKGSEDAIHLAKGTKIAWDERGIVEEILKKKQTPQ